MIPTVITPRPKAHHFAPAATKISPLVVGKTMAEVAAMEMEANGLGRRRGDRGGSTQPKAELRQRRAEVIAALSQRAMSREEVQDLVDITKGAAERMLWRMRKSEPRLRYELRDGRAYYWIAA